MVGTWVDHSFDRRWIPRGAGVGQITFELCHRQIVVFFAEEHEQRRPGIGAAFGNRAKVPGGIESNVCRKAALSGLQRRSNLLKRRQMRDFSAKGETQYGNSIDVDPGLARQPPQRAYASATPAGI